MAVAVKTLLQESPQLCFGVIDPWPYLLDWAIQKNLRKSCSIQHEVKPPLLSAQITPGPMSPPARAEGRNLWPRPQIWECVPFPDGSQLGLASSALAIRYVQTLFEVLGGTTGPGRTWTPTWALQDGLGQGGGSQVAVDRANKTKCHLFNIK